MDQNTWREILTCALLPFACGLLQQPFVRCCLHVDTECGPFGLVNERDEPLQVYGVVEARLSAGVNVAQDAALLAERSQQVHIAVRQLGPALLLEVWPVAPFRQLDLLLVGHLQEQQVRDLLDVVTVVDSVVTERVTESPKHLDDIGHAAMPSFRS